MNIVANLFKSSLGKKFIMAITGAALFLFVVGHLLGNLQVFLGPEAINRYASFLQSNPELIWPARLFLLLMLGLHVWSAVKLSRENKAARPVAYAVRVEVSDGFLDRRRSVALARVHRDRHEVVDDLVEGLDVMAGREVLLRPREVEREHMSSQGRRHDGAACDGGRPSEASQTHVGPQRGT